MEKIEKINYISFHKKNFIISYNTNIKFLRPGDIIEFLYYKEDKKKFEKEYVIVLNERDKENNLLHGLTLELISPSFLKILYKKLYYFDNNNIEIGYKDYKILSKYRHPINKESLKYKTFYDNTIKPLIKIYSKTSIYRTYKIKNIYELELIKYNFENIN